MEKFSVGCYLLWNFTLTYTHLLERLSALFACFCGSCYSGSCRTTGQLRRCCSGQHDGGARERARASIVELCTMRALRRATAHRLCFHLLLLGCFRILVADIGGTTGSLLILALRCCPCYVLLLLLMLRGVGDHIGSRVSGHRGGRMHLLLGNRLGAAATNVDFSACPK